MVANKNRVSNSQKSEEKKFSMNETELLESSRLRKIFSEQNLESTKLGKRFYVWVKKQKEKEQEIVVKEQN